MTALIKIKFKNLKLVEHFNYLEMTCRVDIKEINLFYVDIAVQ